MKKENDELTDLFRSRLGDAQLPVRDHFWENLERDIPVAARRHRMVIYRFTAAASVLFVLMASSAAFWFFSPKEEIADAFTKAEISAGKEGKLSADVVKENFPPIHAASVLHKQGPRSFGVLALNKGDKETEDHDSVSVTVSMSFSFSTTTSRNRKHYQQQQTAMASNDMAGNENRSEKEQGGTKVNAHKRAKESSWAVKAGAGFSLPAADKMHAPFEVSATVEKKITKRFSVETGLAYSCEQSPVNGNMHYVGIPVKANFLIAGNRKLDLYASLGGLVDKCIAGAPDNDFNSEPIQLAITAGLGVFYKISDRLALFAQPGISHHFNPDTQWETARTQKSTNLNLLCGLRMTY
ncbi:porin family protein [uncultured Bacteroides sp.]|uniref:porin family protein n=1 Tax=uncultured Bacteroides sp. TaxID=162156 RepID=UPI002AA88DE3|nr:porin family protein [uncultured Bacteroides sp.]